MAEVCYPWFGVGVGVAGKRRGGGLVGVRSGAQWGC